MGDKMKEVVVVTSFTPTGYDEYAKNFLLTHERWWCKESIKLVLYTHNQKVDGHKRVDLPSTEPAKSFLDRHKNNKTIQGLVELPGWTATDKKLGYSFRYDAYKFARKVFALAHCARSLPKNTKLFWIDADVITHKPVDASLFHRCLPDDVSMCCLQNIGDLTEVSFVGYNLYKSEARDFLAEFEGIYSQDRFTGYPYWDDGHIFDYMVAHRRPNLKFLGYKAHPFEASILGNYMEHLRGGSKMEKRKVDRKVRRALGLPNERG